MTKIEFEWAKDAMSKLSNGDMSEMQQAKVLRTLSQIFDRAASAIEDAFVERVDTAIAHNSLIHQLKK